MAALALDVAPILQHLAPDGWIGSQDVELAAAQCGVDVEALGRLVERVIQRHQVWLVMLAHRQRQELPGSDDREHFIAAGDFLLHP